MISLVIPHMPSPETDAALDNCIKSFQNQYDELIVVANDGMGYGPAVNLGLKYSTGSHIVVSNNDIELVKGNIKDLCWQIGFAVPLITPEPRDYLPRPIFGMPRWAYDHIIERDGFFYDPRYEKGYFEDDDLHQRIKDIPVITELGVWVHHAHGGGLTMKQVGEQEWFDKNQKVFNDKWSPDTYS